MENFEALREVALHKRCVKHHELDILPLWVLSVLPPNDADNLLEVVSASPQLAVESNLRQLGLPLFRSEEGVAIACVHSCSVPVAAYPIQLLGHQPARWIVLLRVVLVSKHDRYATRSVVSSLLLTLLLLFLLVLFSRLDESS